MIFQSHSKPYQTEKLGQLQLGQMARRPPPRVRLCRHLGRILGGPSLSSTSGDRQWRSLVLCRCWEAQASLQPVQTALAACAVHYDWSLCSAVAPCVSPVPQTSFVFLATNGVASSTSGILYWCCKTETACCSSATSKAHKVHETEFEYVIRLLYEKLSRAVHSDTEVLVLSWMNLRMHRRMIHNRRKQ